MQIPRTVLMLLTAFAAVALPTVVCARDLLLWPGIVGNDDRKPQDNQAAPWSAIGQVNIGGYSRMNQCSGTLIAPRVVLTSALCLIDQRYHHPYLVDQVHFAPAPRPAITPRWIHAKCLRFPPNYKYAPPPRLTPDIPLQNVELESLQNGLAEIVLESDAGSPSTPMPISSRAASRDEAVTAAGYPADWRYQLMVDSTCHATGFYQGLLLTDCDTHYGSPGGPILTGPQSAPSLSAILVAFNPGRGNYAVPVQAWPNLPLGGDCP